MKKYLTIIALAACAATAHANDFSDRINEQYRQMDLDRIKEQNERIIQQNERIQEQNERSERQLRDAEQARKSAAWTAAMRRQDYTAALEAE